MNYINFRWKKIIPLIIMLLGFSTHAQLHLLKGQVITKNRGKIEGIPGAKIEWANAEHVALTNNEGYFAIKAGDLPDTLIVKSVGYEAVAFEITLIEDSLKINMKSGKMLKGVVVYGENLGKTMDLKDPMNVETIGTDELRKAACCNLSESFETNASVDVNMTDAVSGAKKIQMLGLDGIYTQLQWENIPLVRGLSSSYGLNFTPGTWIESIQITKGTGSVVNGYETMAGLINLELKKPENAERLYVNAYGNRFSRAELNLHGAQIINDRWSTLTFLHGSNQFVEFDVNNDGFKDQPVGHLLAGFHRWDFKGDKMESRFGIKGTQKKYYFNGIYSDIIGNTNHTYKTGLSFILDDYNQTYRDSNFLKTEIVPGAFFEYTYNHLDDIIIVAGVRGDYHNLYGPLFSPRLHAKWNPNPKSALRLSVGRGYRVPNPYADYTSLMASSRQWIVDPNIQPEDAVSSGLTYTQKFMIGDEVSTFSVDYFYTHFINQLITDMDVSPGELHVYNTNGESFSHSFQAELGLKFFKRFEFRSAFKYYNVQAEFNDQLQQKAFVPKFRVLLNAGFKSRNKKWEIDVTGNWIGKKRLPNTSSNPIEYQRADESVDYWLLNSQITYNLRKVSFYIGGENLLNVIQNDAIISADDPFGSYFDATQVWAPINGFNIYAGLHFTIDQKKK